MSIEYVLSAEECAQESQKFLNVTLADEGTCLNAIGWALLSIAVTLAERGGEK